jgi:hypothetical protein
MKYLYPFGQQVHTLVQQDRTPKKVFVLGVYASAVHARWKKDGKTICPALAVASEPRIFWDGNIEEAREIISKIQIPEEAGALEPAGMHLNGPSAKVLDEHILGALGYTRKDAWLCDLLPETRINNGQAKVIEKEYNPLIEKYGLNEVTIPKRPTVFCDAQRCKEIIAELKESKAGLLILLGDIPIVQFLTRAAEVPYKSLQEYVEQYGYGTITTATVDGHTINVLPLAHPRQIGALGAHSEKWNKLHQSWESKIK